MVAGRCRAIVWWGVLATLAEAFTFTATPSGECGPVLVSWSGGKAPFTIGLHPIDSAGINYAVDTNAYQNGQGATQIALLVAQGRQFVITMGDADGPLTGGASQVFTTDARQQSTQACNTTPLTPDFYWTAPDNNLYQCQSYNFSDIGTSPTAKIQRPTTLYVILPGGSGSFAVPMSTLTSFNWIANVATGTTVIFDMVDAQGNQGGVDTQSRVVGNGGNTCGQLNSLVPASPAPVSSTTTSVPVGPITSVSTQTYVVTSAAGSGTTIWTTVLASSVPESFPSGASQIVSTSGSSIAASASAISTSSSPKISTTSIVGIAVGGGVLLGIVAILLFMISRKKRKQKNKSDRTQRSVLARPAPARFNRTVETHFPTSLAASTPPRNSAYSTGDRSISPLVSASLPPMDSVHSSSGRSTSPRPIPSHLQHTGIAEIQGLDLPPQYTGPSPDPEMGERWRVDSHGTSLSYGPRASPQPTRKFASGSGNF